MIQRSIPQREHLYRAQPTRPGSILGPVPQNPLVSSPAGASTFWLSALYTFLLFSRSSEFIDSHGGLHLAIVTGGPCIIALLMTGNLPSMLFSKQGRWLSVMCFWLFAGLAFSTWKGGSIDLFMGSWIKSYIMFFIVGGLIFSLKQMRFMAIVLAFCPVYQIYLALRSGLSSVDDRLSMSYGTLGNANDLASALLLGLPFLTYVLLDSKTNMFLRITSLPLIVLVFVAVLKTGSRGALVAIAALALLGFVKSSPGNKLKVLVVCLLVTGMFATVIPASLRARYMTIFSSSSAPRPADQGTASAIESGNARRQLLANSVTLTIRHPIFGVGLGQFAPQSFNLLVSQGMGGMWFTAHDIFALVASEAGVPALLFFCGVLASSFRSAWRLSKIPRVTPELETVSNLGFSLVAALLAYFVCGIFNTEAYSYQLPVLASLTVALERVAQPYLSAVAPPSGPVAPPPFLNRKLAQRDRVPVAI
jgi:O-antigen ligase